MTAYVEECHTKRWLSQIDAWKKEHPLTMRPNAVLSPMDIINEMNRQFDEAIIVTTSDSTRCWWRSMQRSRKRNVSSCPEV